MLLLAAQAMRSGTFTVGDFALFTSYIAYVVDVPLVLGGFIADYRTQAVSIRRMLELQPHAAPETLVAPSPVYMQGAFPEPASVTSAAVHRLAKLEASDLTPDTCRSDQGVDVLNPLI